MLRIQIVPYFLVFPVAFTLNRLGQHYNIDPTHPLKWSTVMKPEPDLGLPVRVLELPRRAPLLPERAVLQPAQRCTCGCGRCTTGWA